MRGLPRILSLFRDRLHKLNNTVALLLGLKPGTSCSQVEHFTTEPMAKDGMIQEFGSFHIDNKLMLRPACICERPY